MESLYLNKIFLFTHLEFEKDEICFSQFPVQILEPSESFLYRMKLLVLASAILRETSAVTSY